MSTPADNDGSPDIDDENTEGEEKQGKKKTKKQKKAARKKLIILGAGALVAVLAIGGGVAYFVGWLNPLFGIQEETKTAELELGNPVTHVLPQIKADLKTSKCKSPFLRATISVQLSENDLERIQEAQDKVMDQLITHLRDQERQDLVGKAGSDQLRFDIVSIINNVIKPSRIHGIIFKEFVLQ